MYDYLPVSAALIDLAETLRTYANSGWDVQEMHPTCFVVFGNSGQFGAPEYKASAFLILFRRARPATTRVAVTHKDARYLMPVKG
jgi:hypothetical protein